MQEQRIHGVFSRWIGISLSNLFIAAVIGVLLRYAFIEEIPGFEFRNWLHAHSHTAMLGWVSLALYVLIFRVFIPHPSFVQQNVQRLFWLIQIVVWIMLAAFVMQGYQAFSIVALVVYVLLSYLLIFLVWKHLPREVHGQTSGRLLRMSLVFQIISTLALWTIPVLTVNALRGTEYYYMAIQFFLHFQFNGWFTFCILALFFRAMEQQAFDFPPQIANLFFVLMVVSCFLTYALAVAWSNPLPLIFGINGTGVSVQFIALIVLCFLLYPRRKEIHAVFSGNARTFVYTALGCLILKIFMQTAVVIPFIAKVGYTIRNFVIGFMHLILLGVVTMGIFGFAYQTGLLNRSAKPGAILVLIGFLMMELLLFGQGILLWASKGFFPYYYESIFGVSGLIVIGVVWMLGGRLSKA